MDKKVDKYEAPSALFWVTLFSEHHCNAYLATTVISANNNNSLEYTNIYDIWGSL